MDSNEKLKQGKQAALAVGVWGFALSVVIAIAVGFFFADAPEPLLRRSHFAIAALGFIVTAYVVFHILTRDIEMHHYRENLKAEKEAERVEAEIAELNARAALARAKERAIFAPAPGRVPARLPEAPERAMYRNGERVDEAIEEPEDDSLMDEKTEAPSAALVQTGRNQWRFIERSSEPEEIAEPAPGISARGQTVITESADAYNLRIRNLANEIYNLCRDVNPPTQKEIMRRIPRTSHGLLRSNDDITRALDALAERGLIEPSKGQGITRKWLHSAPRATVSTLSRVSARE